MTSNASASRTACAWRHQRPVTESGRHSRVSVSGQPERRGHDADHDVRPAVDADCPADDVCRPPEPLAPHAFAQDDDGFLVLEVAGREGPAGERPNADDVEECRIDQPFTHAHGLVGARENRRS